MAAKRGIVRTKVKRKAGLLPSRHLPGLLLGWSRDENALSSTVRVFDR